MDVLRVEDAETESVADLACWADGAVDRVVEGRIDGVRLVDCVGRRLPVRRLRLNVSGKDILGPRELILVESMVLDAVSIEPNIGALYEKATASEDGDTSAVPIIEIVIGSLPYTSAWKEMGNNHRDTYPKPVILHVDTSRRLRDMHVGVGSIAFRLVSHGGTLRDLEICALRAANSSVYVP